MARHRQLFKTFTLMFVFFTTTLTAQAQSREPDKLTLPRSIEQFRDAFVSAVRDRDVNTWAELFEESGVMMLPTGEKIEGRIAFKEYWNRAFQGRTGPNPLEVEIHEAKIVGRLAVVRADYGPVGREPVGHYLWVLEREDNESWMLAWWIYNRRSNIE